MKQELIKRYRYLFLNSEIILSSMLITLDNEERLILNNKYYEDSILDLLFSEDCLENSEFYNLLNNLIHQDTYIEQVYSGLNKVTSIKDGPSSNLWHLLTILRNYLLKNSPKDILRRQKLETLDEYYRLNRVDYNQTVYVSGYHLEFEDIPVTHFRYLKKECSIHPEYRSSNISPIKNKNNFLEYFSSISIDSTDKEPNHLSNDEIIKVYLSLHDVISKHISISCENDYDAPLTIDNTIPCKNTFYLNEEDIIFNLDGSYYQVCKNCGYHVFIPEEILPEPVQERIIKRTKKGLKYNT